MTRMDWVVEIDRALTFHTVAAWLCNCGLTSAKM